MNTKRIKSNQQAVSTGWLADCGFGVGGVWVGVRGGAVHTPTHTHLFTKEVLQFVQTVLTHRRGVPVTNNVAMSQH